MSAYRISEVAGRTGIPATTLRYYEDVGIVPAPERTATGYRLYDDRTLARLRFISGAKQLGLSLEEIRALVKLWEGDECAPVQHIAARLRGEPHAGPCDDTCACGTTETAPAAAPPVELAMKASRPGEAAIARTLTGAEDVVRRVDDWQRLRMDRLHDPARRRLDDPGSTSTRRGSSATDVGFRCGLVSRDAARATRREARS